MFDYDLALDIDQELSEIPPEYQDIFRQTIEQELAETEQNRTDTDILTYLREREDNFKRGGFIRPDGRSGLVALNPETMYEQALPELARSSRGEPDPMLERRRTLVKVGVLATVVLVFLFVVFRGRSQRTEDLETSGTPLVSSSEEVAVGTATATPALPEISSVDASLQTIGGLGGALTIGRPSVIELYYGRTEETIALAIDPSQSTPKGELRYSEAAMLSDNPVAVWLFGTVLNYALGIPDSLVRNLETGDRITLSSDTGASLRFVVAETQQGANYEAGRMLSQNRLGLTLFALPAAAEDDVSFAFANYDVISEESQGQPVYEVGERIALGVAGELQISTMQTSHTSEGAVRIVVNGNMAHLGDDQSVLLSLTASSEQTTAVALAPDAEGNWQTSFTLPDSTSGLPLLAEFRTLPTGSLSLVQLGIVPHLTEQLAVDIEEAWWSGGQKQITLQVTVHNPGEGAVYISSDFVQTPTIGGDVDEPTWQVVPRLPRLINPGETMGITISFFSPALSGQVQIGAELWEVAAIPAE